LPFSLLKPPENYHSIGLKIEYKTEVVKKNKIFFNYLTNGE